MVLLKQYIYIRGVLGFKENMVRGITCSQIMINLILTVQNLDSKLLLEKYFQFYCSTEVLYFIKLDVLISW